MSARVLAGTGRKAPLFATFTSRFAIRSKEGDIYPCERPGLPHKGLERIARIFHRRAGSPVTWFLDWTAAIECGRLFRGWHEEYGDEVALWLDEFGPKTWLGRLGGPFRGQKSLYYSLEEQRQMIRFVRETIETEAYGPITTAAGLWFNEVTVQALDLEGFASLWGYCWHQENVDEATHRGCPWYPFYPDSSNYKIPSRGKRGVVGVHWFVTDMTNAHFACENHEIGFVRLTPHPGEEDRSGFARDGSLHTRKMLSEWDRQRRWNDFVYTTFHLECDWVSGQWDFPNGVKHADRVVDLFETYLDEVTWLEGSQVVTVGEFADWFRGRYDETPTQCFHFRDTIPDRRLWFKDRANPDAVFYGNRNRKLVFARDRGTLPIEILDYSAGLRSSPSQRYPSAGVHHGDVLNSGYLHSFGVWLDAQQATWRAKLRLTSSVTIDEFGIMLWGLNLPENVEHSTVSSGPNVRELRWFGDEQDALVIFDLVPGVNEIELTAPVEGLGMGGLCDRRSSLEIQIENLLHSSVRLAGVCAHIGPGHPVKDVVCGQSIIPMGYIEYDSKGLLRITCYYPETLELAPGVSTLTVELCDAACARADGPAGSPPSTIEGTA